MHLIARRGFLEGCGPLASRTGTKNKTKAIDRNLSSTLIRPHQGHTEREEEQEREKEGEREREMGEEKTQKSKAKEGQNCKPLWWRKKDEMCKRRKAGGREQKKRAGGH